MIPIDHLPQFWEFLQSIGVVPIIRKLEKAGEYGRFMYEERFFVVRNPNHPNESPIAELWCSNQDAREHMIGMWLTTYERKNDD